MVLGPAGPTVCSEVSSPKHAGRDVASGDPEGWGDTQREQAAKDAGTWRGKKAERVHRPRWGARLQPEAWSRGRWSHRGPAWPAPRGSGQGCALFQSPGRWGACWPRPAWPLSSAHADELLPFGADRTAKPGCLPASGCATHGAGLSQSLDAGPLGRWTALGSAAPGHGQVPKTAHTAAAFTSRPVLKIAWIGPLFAARSRPLCRQRAARGEAFSSCGLQP